MEDKILKITELYADYYANKITLGELHDGVERQIQQLMLEARTEGYKKGYVDGGIGFINGETPFKRRFVTKDELKAELKSQGGSNE